jgi:hypothetical protein
MDEVKKLVSEGDTAAAEEVASAEFGLDEEAAKTAVEQVATDMKYSETEPEPVEPEIVEETPPTPAPFEPEPVVVEAQPVGEPPKPPSKTNPWLIGGIGAVLFLCLCCCLPTLIAIVAMARNR